MFLVGCDRSFACFCLQINSKSYGWILMKLSEIVANDTMSFGRDPDHCLDLGMSKDLSPFYSGAILYIYYLPRVVYDLYRGYTGWRPLTRDN